MSLKSRILGILAATVLTLSMSAGVMAQQTDSEQVSVTLENQVCGLDISTANGSFGTWAWNGSAWENTGTNDSVYLDGALSTPPQQTCTVSVSFGGLDDGSGHVISTNSFAAASHNPGPASRSAAGWVQENVSGTEYDFEFELISIGTDLPAGTYTGSVDITIVNTA
jgi:hypothetical protein